VRRGSAAQPRQVGDGRIAAKVMLFGKNLQDAQDKQDKVCYILFILCILLGSTRLTRRRLEFARTCVLC
jgi:hypothetical protein